MILKYQHDFTGDSNYHYPFVLVYRGSAKELGEVKRWCEHAKLGEWARGVVHEVDEKIYTLSFHFANKSDAMLCKLSHAV